MCSVQGKAAWPCSHIAAVACHQGATHPLSGPRTAGVSLSDCVNCHSILGLSQLTLTHTVSSGADWNCTAAMQPVH
jgi:hypothetical protein